MSREGLLSGAINTGVVCVPGYMPTNPADRTTPALAIAPRFFETWKIPLLLGRDLSWSDREGTPRVAVVNEAFARIFYGGKNPVGLTMGYECPEKPSSITIIGVVADAKYQRVRETIRPTVYLPYRQWPTQAMTFALRTLGNPAAIAGAARRVMAELDADVPVFNLYTQLEQIDRGIQQERLIAYLLVFFGLIALSLACLGIYGTLAHAVNRRTSEIGLRMALGARRAHIIGTVLRESLVPVLIGIVLGLCTALALTRLVQGIYFGISPNDPLSIVVAVAALILAAILAALLPARRAASIDPMNTLRSE
jgi:predicted permease